MKTVASINSESRSRGVIHTEARGKDSDVKVGGKLLHLRREHPLACYDVAGQADTNNLQDGLENKHSEMR